MELDSVAKIKYAFYRLVGSDTDDDALTEQGESQDDVAYLYLTRGCRKAQRVMLDARYNGWRKRSAAITWSGTDATTGGVYSDLPSDFLKAYSDHRQSALRKANGDQWGFEIEVHEGHLKGDFYYLRGDELWLTRTARPPTTLYLEYHYLHPLWSASLTPINFPMESRYLIAAEAAYVAMNDNWLPGGEEMKAGIHAAVLEARKEARHIARRSKTPRTFMPPRRVANRW